MTEREKIIVTMIGIQGFLFGVFITVFIQEVVRILKQIN